MKSRHGLVIALLLTVLFPIVPTPRSAIAEPRHGAARATPVNQNLVQNPGAELDTADPSGNVVKPRRWTTTGGFSVVAYGTPGYPGPAESRRIGGGDNIFAGGVARSSSAAQVIRLRGLDRSIDGGAVRVQFAASMAGASGQPDSARVVLQFLGGSGNVLGRAELPKVTGIDRFARKERTAAIPPRTRSLRLTLTATGSGPHTDAYFDNASVVLLPAPPNPGDYRLEHIIPGASFNSMLDFAPIPGSNFAVVVTKEGPIYRVPITGTGASLFANLAPLLADSMGNEEGVLGLAFSPTYETDHLVYVDYTADRSGGHKSVLSRFKVKGNSIDLSSEQVLLQIDQPYENHNGGRLAFGPDGYLYYSLGDGGSGGDPHRYGQNLNTLLGKILRLDVSGSGGYSIPGDNPFIDTAGARDEIWAYGLRNTWRFSFDRATGELWAGDVGQNRWEEVDRIVRGGNYGWNVLEGFECYNASSCNRSGKIPPRTAYGHDEGCSITGGYVYRGSASPELDGYFIYGDFCTGRVWGVKTIGTADPVLLVDSPYMITSFGELPSGEVIAVTFNGALYRLGRKP